MRETPVGEEPTNPFAVAEAGASTRRPEVDEQAAESTEAEGSSPSLFRKVGRRAVMLPVACVAALLVGFGAVTAMLSVGDSPAESDTKPTVTTAVASVPAPTSPPAVSAPPSTAAEAPAVEAPPPPAPPPQPQVPAPEAASPAPTTSAPPTTTAPTTTPTTTTPAP